MQQGQKASKKWVDFSDQSEEQCDQPQERSHQNGKQGARNNFQQQPSKPRVVVDHRSEAFILEQTKLLSKARERQSEIWVLLECQQHFFLDKTIKQFKEKENKDIINIYMNKQITGGWDLKVTAELLEKWIKQGLDSDRKIKVSVADRNFRSQNRDPQRDRNQNGQRRGRGRGDNYNRGERGDRGDRGDRRGRGDRGDRRGREGRGDRNNQQGGRRNREGDGDNKKKSYVDKNTGKAPSNKIQVEQKIIEEKERHYSKQQAERVGLELGNFRNKPKTEQKVEAKIEPQPYVETIRKPKDDVKWSRKDRDEKRQDKQQQIEKEVERKPKKEYRQKVESSKDSEEKPPVQKKKKQYVRVDDKIEKEKIEEPKKKPVQQDKKDLLSEDSN